MYIRYHQDSCTKQRVFGAANLSMQATCVSPTPVAMVTKICKFTYYIYINPLKFKIGLRFLHTKLGVLEVNQFHSHCDSSFCRRTTVAMVKTNLMFQNQICYKLTHRAPHLCTKQWVFGVRYLNVVIQSFARPTLVDTVTNKKAQLTLTKPRDSKGCKNCTNSTCFVSFHRITFPQISNYQSIASRGIFNQAIGLYCYTQFEIRCLPFIKFLV